MPENILALIYVLILSAFVLFGMQSLAIKKDFLKQLNLLKGPWYVITCLGFLVSNYWFFLSLVGVYLKVYIPKTIEKKMCVVIFCALIMPPLSLEIPGFFGINNFGTINWYRFLIILILLPECIALLQKGSNSFLNYYSDLFVCLFFLLLVILDASRTPSATDAVRMTFYHFIDILVPYYVFSRGIKTTDDIKKIFFSLTVAISIAAFLAIFESLKGWHFYDSASYNLGMMRSENINNYKYRAGLLRASGAYGTIPLGYLTAITFFCAYSLFSKMRGVKVKAVYGVLILAMLATLSRGPWVAFFIAISILFLLKGKAVYLVVRVMLVAIVVSLSPVGDKFTSLLPGVGNDSGGTISYRQDLYVTSLDVMKENLLFGSSEVLNHPKMQHLIQGEGIIDVVNTYLQISLDYGVVTLICMLCILFLPILKLYRMSKRRIYSNEERIFSYVLIAMMMQTIVTIATVSSLGGGTISFFMWILIAMVNAYINILMTTNESRVKVKNSI